jgi:hypothetical protein
MNMIYIGICLLFLLGGIQIIRIARMRKLPEMYWLAANFIFAAVGNFFSVIVLVPMLSMVAMIATGVCLVMFVQYSFYRDRKSPYLFIIGLLLVLAVWQIYSTITSPASFFSLTQLGFAVIWGWQAFLAIKTHRHFAKDETVEDWIKGRYLFWFAYTFASFLMSVRMLLPLPYQSFEQYITTPLLILAVIVQYITWVMPEPVRRFLNRNYKPKAMLSPNELMVMAEAELSK